MHGSPHGSDSDPVRPIRLVHVTTISMSLNLLRGQGAYFAARGWRVDAVTSGGPEAEAFREREGARVHRVEMARPISLVRDVAALAALVRLFRRLRPHIVQAGTPKGGLLGMVAAGLTGVPVRIYQLRGLPMLTAPGLHRAVLRAAERVACRLSHRVLCVSPSLREAALAEGLCPLEKLAVVGDGSSNGVDAEGRFDPLRLPEGARRAAREALGIPPEAAVVGFVGRLVRDKGVPELEEAWRLLRYELPQLHLLLVGPFEARDPVPADVERVLRADPRVHLVGEDWDTPRLYAAMDLVALPTRREGFPNVPLEAAAMELPVVATRVVGCVDAIEDGLTGTLVPVGDPAALAEALRRYAMDPELRRSHGMAGRRRVLERFRPESVWRGLEEEYEGLLRRSGIRTAEVESRSPDHAAPSPG